MIYDRNLALKLAGSIVTAFIVSMAFTWCLQDFLARRDADKLIENAFGDVSNTIVSRINMRLVRQAMAARERLEDGYATDMASLKKLAEELQVTEVCLADGKGVVYASSEPSYMGFDFNAAGGQAQKMMCLVRNATEYCQPFRQNAANGTWRKFVGVWRPEGGFVEIGCDGDALRNLSRTTLTGITANWHVSGMGGVVITTKEGLVISDLAEKGREGTHWREPDDSYYWQKHEIDGFPVYVMIPKSAAAVTRNVLVATTALLNGAALVFVAILVGFVISGFVRRKIREQNEKELKMATDIQFSALPSVFPPFPDETSFEIFASMKTAKEVGGDFYDFYFTGPRTIAFLVADVSGKGVPAAMFMMRAKTILKSTAQTGKPLAQVVSETNDVLCEGNDANMFVTAWVGELNVETGLVTFVNAGHNPPMVRRGETVSPLGGKPGLVLGAFSGIPYRSCEIQLTPGDALYLYTDGITEQPNAVGELFGEARLRQALSSGLNHQSDMLTAILKAVQDYADGVEQADDCTQLIIRYRGPATTTLNEYVPTVDDLTRATGDLERSLASVPMKEQMKLMVAADEIFANIVKYSGATKWTLKVELLKCPAAVRLVFTDDGKPFDPLAQRDPDTTLSAEERSIGGMGILIVKKTMSPVTYCRKNGQNVLTLGLTYGEQ